MQIWLKSRKVHIAQSTFFTYSDILKKHIIPYFQSHPIRLVDMKPFHIEEYYGHLETIELSPNTILKHHANIHKALKEAQKHEMILRNPAALVERPRKQKYIPEPYSREETVRLLECIKGDPMELLIHLTAFYGLRRSEVAGLRWKDINFEKNTITIRHSLQRRTQPGKKPVMLAQNTLKRDASYRTLPLNREIANSLTQCQRSSPHATQENNDYIFRMNNGDVMKPNYITVQFSKILAKHALRHIRFHDLRHGCASILISERVPLIEVQQWLGHGNISTTADMYAHLDFSMKERSAVTLSTQLYTKERKYYYGKTV